MSQEEQRGKTGDNLAQIVRCLPDNVNDSITKARNNTKRLAMQFMTLQAHRDRVTMWPKGLRHNSQWQGKSHKDFSCLPSTAAEDERHIFELDQP